MRVINIPNPTARDECDRAFAVARKDSGQPAVSMAYRLMSRGAHPDDPRGLIDGVRRGDLASIDRAIEWLRLDPFCLYSGYLKQTLMRALAQQHLSTRQADAIRQLLLALLTRGRREEFRAACRLARAVNSPQFRAELEQATHEGDADSRQRAKWMLDGCQRVLAS
jgi:hypothetical protein